ncbi:MAG: hypothetical protein Q4D10_01535 [Bacteroidales bacterium]|nr:hypothetical protein [Bacteroidales bacterium]
MKALPSIAFSEFKGTAGDVTARRTGGRTVLNGRAQHSHIKTPKQCIRRASFGYITRQFKQLTAVQQKAWQKLAEAHRERALVGAEGVPLTAHNLFVCLNANRALVGVPIALDAPAEIHGSDRIAFDDIWITPERIMITGLRDADNPNARLVVKMSPGQGAGISKAWDKTVIVGDFETSDWGDLDLLEVYTKNFGIDVVPGQKYFLELYWIDELSGYVSEKTYVCFPATEGESAHGQTFAPRALIKSDEVTGGDSSSEAISCEFELASGSKISVNEIEARRTSGYSAGVYLKADDSVDMNRFSSTRSYQWARGFEDTDVKFGVFCCEVYPSSWGNTIQLAGRGGLFQDHFMTFGTYMATR